MLTPSFHTSKLTIELCGDIQVVCAEALLDTVEEELTCDRLITSARRRDSSAAKKLVDKVLNIVNSKHGPWADDSTEERYD